MVALSRRCARPTCAAEAVASMAYDYAARRVEVGPLGAQRHPARYDLCATHTASLTPPRGWRVDVDPGTMVDVHAAEGHTERRSATG